MTRQNATRLGQGMAFEQWLKDHHSLDVLTAKQYRQRVQKFQRRLPDLWHASTDDLFRAERLNRKRVSPSTRNGNKRALMLWYEWAGRRDGGPARDLPRVKPPPGLPRPVAPDDRKRYLEAARRLGARHLLMARLGTDAGLRIHEVSRTKWADLVGDELYVKGKGSKMRAVPLTVELLDAWNAWQKEAPLSEWVFARLIARSDAPAEHVSPEQIRWMHVAVCDEAGLACLNFHRLRHTAATAFYRASGGDLLATGQFLGHSDPKSTRVYALVQNERLKTVVRTMYQEQ